VAALVLGSCTGIKPGSRSAGKKLYETFYVGNEGTQYFIKPLLLKGENSSELKLDITFRHKTDLASNSTLNFTVISQELLKTLDSLTITNTRHAVSSKNISLLFTERAKAGFSSRFTTNIPSGELQKLFHSPDWSISLYQGSRKIVFTPGSNTQKKIRRLDYNIFSIL